MENEKQHLTIQTVSAVVKMHIGILSITNTVDVIVASSSWSLSCIIINEDFKKKNNKVFSKTLVNKLNGN